MAMLGNKGNKFCMMTQCAISFISGITLFVCYVMICAISGNNVQTADLNNYVAFQISDDWDKLPWVDIEVSDSPCQNDIFFQNVWPGTVEGCKVYYNLENRLWTKQEYSKLTNKQKKRIKCHKINSISQRVQSKFLGKYICGTRGGIPFSEVKRPYTQGQCPSGTTACSEQTDFENTLCYPNDRLNECPITFMQVIQNSQIGDYQTDDNEIKTFDSDYSIVISKKKNHLPIQNTKVEKETCILPQELSGESNKIYYKLEKSTLQQCTFFQEKNLDPRYTQMDYLQVNEFDVQTGSQVIDTLRSLYKYDDYFDPNDDIKKNYLYNFWTRNTIPWKQVCENQNSRREIADLLKHAAKNNNWMENLLVLSIVCIIFHFILMIAGKIFIYCATKSIFSEIPSTIIQIIFFSLSDKYKSSAYSFNQERLVDFQKYSVLNGCVDNLTFIDIDKTQQKLEQFNKDIDKITQLWEIMLIFFLIQFILPIIDGIYTILKKCYHQQRKKSDQTKKEFEINVDDEMNREKQMNIQDRPNLDQDNIQEEYIDQNAKNKRNMNTNQFDQTNEDHQTEFYQNQQYQYQQDPFQQNNQNNQNTFQQYNQNQQLNFEEQKF